MLITLYVDIGKVLIAGMTSLIIHKTGCDHVNLHRGKLEVRNNSLLACPSSTAYQLRQLNSLPSENSGGKVTLQAASSL